MVLQVVRCHDFRCSRPVAIKVVRNKKRFQQQAMVEVKLLSYLLENNAGEDHNVVHLLVSWWCAYESYLLNTVQQHERVNRA